MSDDDFMSSEIRAEWEEYKEQLRRKKPRAERSNGEAGDELITVCAATITPRRINWVWRDRFARGKVGVLGGHPDEGKSLILAEMIARATRGSNWPCGEGQAPVGNEIMLTAEDDLGDTVINTLPQPRRLLEIANTHVTWLFLIQPEDCARLVLHYDAARAAFADAFRDISPNDKAAQEQISSKSRRQSVPLNRLCAAL